MLVILIAKKGTVWVQTFMGESGLGYLVATQILVTILNFQSKRLLQAKSTISSRVVPTVSLLFEF